MSFPDQAALKTLDFAFRGQPFLDISLVGETWNLDIGHMGCPFAGTKETDETVVSSSPAMVMVSGAVAGIVAYKTPACLGTVSVSGSICDIFLVHRVAPPAAIMSVISTIPGIISTAIPPWGEISALATCVNVWLQGGVISVPGEVAVVAKVAGLLLLILPGPAYVQALASIIQIACTGAPVAADPGVIDIGGHIGGVCFSVCAPAQIVADSAAALIFCLSQSQSEMIVMGGAHVRRWKAQLPVVTYQCLLTGGADGLDDVVIPISSFQFRKRAL